MKRRKQTPDVGCGRECGRPRPSPAQKRRQGGPFAKGTSRRVILVHPPAETLFEQIICVVRDDAAKARGVTEAEVLRQALQAMEACGLGRPLPPKRRFADHLLLWLSAAALLLALLLCLCWQLRLSG